MVRVIIGAMAAALAMAVIGFIFFATPLAGLGQSGLDNAPAAEVQRALATHLPHTGTYSIPDARTSEQTIMYGQGPIATVHYNVAGFPAFDASTLLTGLILQFIVALLMAAGLAGIATRVPDFPSRARLVVLFAVAAAAMLRFSEPIYFHHDWGHFIYLFVANSVVLSAGGLVIARWFLGGIRDKRVAVAPSDV